MSQPGNSLRTILAEALAIVDLDQRAAYLASACGNDAALRKEVEELIRAQCEAGGFLPEQPRVSGPTDAPTLPSEATTLNAPMIEQAGDRVGRYRLLQKIGEGGCGAVYRAQQEEPVRRRVAFKVIKLGMDTRQVVARFEAERQALALMDHPHIAKVLDGGVTEAGRPFFVMELVQGIPITRYCDERKLDTPQRLKLFVQLSQAIEHAHRKGIIHRDIKPSNILVSDQDGVAVPKVIDFGIAKATAGQVLTDKTLFTALEQFVGTPDYMSPEQAQLSGLDIDNRSDIYSLGVLLYELLIGRPPFDPQRLRQAGFDELRRIIREEDPPPPSTRLGTLAKEEQTTVASHRQSEPAKLVGTLRGDLDCIVMKALEKDRNRRYDTAKGLGTDVERYLNHEPILARRPSRVYRLGKFTRRHRLAMTAGGVVVAGLLIAGSLSIWALRVARQNRNSAVPGFEKSVAVLPFDIVSDTNSDAFLSEGLTDNLTTVLLRVPGLRVPSRAAVQQIWRQDQSFESVGRRLQVRALLHGTVLRSADRLRVTAQLTQAADGSQLWRETYNRQITNLFEIQNEVAQGVAKALKGVLLPKERDHLNAGQPTVNLEAYRLYVQGRSHFNRFTYAEDTNSLSFFRQALALDPKYALAYAGMAASSATAGVKSSTSRTAGFTSTEHFLNAKQYALKALELDPSLGEAQAALGIVAMFFEYDWREAGERFTNSLQFAPEHVDAHHFYGHYLEAMNRTDEAVAAFEKAINLEPSIWLLPVELANVYYHGGRFDQAAEQCQKALGANPDAVWAYEILAAIRLRQGKAAEALDAIGKARGIAAGRTANRSSEGGLVSFPRNPVADLRPAHVAQEARALVALDRRAEALERLDEIKNHFGAEPYALALVYSALGDADQAIEQLRIGVESHNWFLIFLKVDPSVDELRTHEGFKAVLRTLKLEQ
jgi:serine/threonine protein kinase/tetratricopeptide (TPR) repeat protein